jgi:4-amino-4-deoxy-L-arabinose transferase-like glycosyltransferase
LRAIFLERQALWNDEMFTFDVAGLPWGEIQARLLTHDDHPPLYFYLARAALGAFGPSAWAIRVVSAVAGGLAVGMVYLAGERLFGRRAAWAGALICLVSPLHIAYSQEGRPYALAGLFALWSVLALLVVLRGRGRWWKLSFVVGTTALLYTHHWGVFVVAGELALVLADRGASRRWRELLPVAAPAAILYLPELIALASARRVPWPPGSDVSIPAGAWELVRLGGAFAGVSFPMAASSFALPTGLVVTGGAAMVVLLALAVRTAGPSEPDAALRSLLVCASVTLLVPFIVSFWVPKIFLWYRYPVILFPVVCVALGAAAARSRAGAFAAALLVVVGLSGAVHYQGWSKSNVREVAIYAGQAARRDSVRFILRPKPFAFLLNYYDSSTVPRLDEAYLDGALGGIVDTARAFVYISLDVPNAIRDYMDGHFVKVEERRFPGEAHLGMVVGVYRQPPEADAGPVREN